MDKKDLFVSVVCPLFQDGQILTDFVGETMEVLRSAFSNYEVILIDDGSDDQTHVIVGELLKKHVCLRVIRLSRSYGRDVAITAGLESAIGDFVVVMIAESDPPNLIPEMVEKCRSGSGIVNGVTEIPRKRSWAGKILSRVFHDYFRKFLRIDLVPDSTDFRVLSRQALNAVTQIKGRYRQLRLLASSVGFTRHNVTYRPLNRSGRTAETRGLLREIAEGVELLMTFSIHPLRWVSLLGLMAGFVNLLYLGYVVAVYFLKKDVAEGWTTLSFQQGVMFFLIFVILTLLTEYVGRILDEGRDQPLYFISEEQNSSVLLSDATRRNITKES
jgi:polyisoprenyl-phosphate glycosyltransferase